jgi:hypothetical protein
VTKSALRKKPAAAAVGPHKPKPHKPQPHKPQPPRLDAGLADALAYSVAEFCRLHRFSIQLFYKSPHLMPTTFRVGNRILISKEAAARWRAEREQAVQP